MERPILQYILSISLTFISLFLSAHETFGTFKDWEFLPTGVVGIQKLADTHGKVCCSITAVDANTVKIEQLTAGGIAQVTVTMTYLNGELSSLTSQNQWGKVYHTLNFTPLGNNEYMVTSWLEGSNQFLPAKAAKYTFVNNLLVEIKYISFDGSICNGPHGVAIEKYKKYDQDDNRYTYPKECSYYDELENPVINRDKDYHKIVYQYDDRGNEVAGAYFDEKGRPMPNRLGRYKYAKAYDADGNETECRNLDINGNVSADLNGVAITKNEYKNGFKIKTTFYNTANHIVQEANAGSGVAITQYSYDARGNKLVESYFDAAGKPMNAPSGIQRITSKYSDLNMLVATEYFDKYEEPVDNNDNIHMYTYGYDKFGRKTEIAYFDRYYAPVKNSHDKVYMTKYTYDSEGRELTWSFWRNETTGMNRWDGTHGAQFKYNAQGQLTEGETVDLNWNPLPNSAGYSKMIIIYNTNCQESEKLFFNGDKPALVSDGRLQKFHSMRFVYDKKNRVSVIEYFDKSGKPADASLGVNGGYTGWKVELFYTGDQLTSEKIYSLDESASAKTIDCLKNDCLSASGFGIAFQRRTAGH